MVRCKFLLSSITHESYGGKRYRFVAQYDQSIPEDQRFAKATPDGDFTMRIDNPVAQEFFKLGNYYYFDATPASA